MTFNGRELTAMIRLAFSMALADGDFAQSEQKAVALELVQFGVQPNQVEGLLKAASSMEGSEAISIVSNMNTQQKKYVCAYLAVIMAADGEVKDSEMRMWQLTCTLSSIPTMSFGEALEFWTKN